MAFTPRPARDLSPGDALRVNGRTVHVEATNRTASFTPVVAVRLRTGQSIYFLAEEPSEETVTVTHTCPLCEKHAPEGEELTLTGTSDAVRALLADHLALLEHDPSEIAEYIVWGLL
ncbi:hypothetical protein ACWFMI_23935 [Nocardiopsis terrae]|uniref:hypothetical protein n=1 Tax=Streptomyces sp. NPDC057554 TaxID=3350538 RepID=UPI00369B258F